MNVPNGSITPPCSPPPLEIHPCDEGSEPFNTSFQELSDGSLIVCFTCEGAAQDGATHSNSLLRQGTVQKLKNGSLNCPFDVTIPEEIFGEHFVLQQILKDGLDRLFFHAKKLISRLENFTEVSSLLTNPDTLAECLTSRREIIKFFNYLKTYVYRCITMETAPVLVPRLLHHLRGLLLHIQRLADLPSHVIGSAASSQQSCSRHVFHLHLDLHWSLLELLHIITDHWSEVTRDNPCTWCKDTGNVVDTDVFSQCVRMFLWDIISLSMRTHSMTSSQQYWQVTPYACGCVREVMIMLLHLMSHRQVTLDRQSFWTEVTTLLSRVLQSDENNYPALEETDCDVFSVPPDYTCADPGDFCWWFLMHLAPLYTYDEFGVSQKQELVTSNYPFMEQLLKKSLTLRESRLRRHLRCCLRLTELWEGNVAMLNTLWDHFYKCLNDQFHTPGNGLSGLACVSKTPASLLERCQSLVQVGNYGTDHDTSFHLFLRLLAMHLGKSASGDLTLWKKLKGRFYSKFHSRRMQDLSETGLNNLTTLFLSLTYVVSLQDLGSKLFDLYHMLDMRGLDIHRHRAIWRGSFALMMRFLEQELDVGFMADKMVEDCNWVCVELRNSAEGKSPNHELVMFYVDSLLDIMDTSTLYLHQHQLIGVGLCDLLQCCRVSDLAVLLDLVHSLLIRHRIVSKRVSVGHDKTQPGDNNSALLYCRELAAILWQHFYQFVRVHSTTLTPPPLLADLAAGFTLLLLTSPPGGQTGVRETVKDCFLYFGCSEHVNATISCRYLCHMMPNKDVMSQLEVALTNHESRLIQAWLQCSCLLPSDTSMLQELTRLVLKLDSVQQIFSKAGIDTTNSSDVTVCLFIRALGAIYSQLTDLKSKTETRREVDRYLQGVPGCVSVVLKTSSKSLHHNICLLTGWLVRHCAPILYVKSKPDCLLPILLDRLVLPRILLTPAKSMPPHMLSALQKTLYLFVQGLCRLDFKRDPYLQRKLKDIILLYLPRFPLLSSGGPGVTVVHPLLTSVSESCRVVPVPDSKGLRLFFLQVLSTACLTPRGTVLPPHSHLAMTFVDELFNKTMNRAVLARDCTVLLPVVLQYMLCCENASLKQHCARVLQMMLEAVRDHPETTDRTALTETLKRFLAHMKGSHGRVLRVLESVSVLCPSIVVDVIPPMTQAVKTSESLRGVGVDKELRLAYHSVLKNLGSHGNEEWSSLLLDS